MRPFFKYPGSKHQAAKHYPKPEHSRIIEPFAGSACYSTRYAEKQVILVEKDPEIATLWGYLIHANTTAVRNLPTQLDPGIDIRSLGLEYGAALLIRQWQRVGRNDCWTVSKWCGANSGFWCEATRNAIADQVQYIRHWRIFCGDALSWFDTRREPSTWFVDPPYVGKPFYKEKFSEHEALGKLCQGMDPERHQVIVCEAGEASWLPFRDFRRQVTGRRGAATGSKEKSRELVWSNDPRRP